jgi:LytS/YehU family sensor histidine kinase
LHIKSARLQLTPVTNGLYAGYINISITNEQQAQAIQATTRTMNIPVIAFIFILFLSVPLEINGIF